MPRRRSRGKRNNRRRGGGNLLRIYNRNNAVIKGTVKYGGQVDISLSDFMDFSHLPLTNVRPLFATITVTVMNAPTYLSIAQWDGQHDNSYFRIDNILLNKTSKYRRTLRWPKSAFMYTRTNSTQILLQVIHCAGGDVYGSEPPLLFYLVDLTIGSARDMMDQTVDPPHYNIKHGEPRASPSSSYEMVDV